MNSVRTIARRSAPLALLILLLVSAGARPAFSSPSPRESLAQAGRQYLDQEYEAVIRILAPLSRHRMKVPLRISMYELMGLSYLIMGDQRGARQAFEMLLGLDPDHILRDPSGSPKLRSFFDLVKMSFISAAKRAQLEFADRTPREARAGGSLEVSGVFTQGEVEAISTVVLRWRQGGTFSFHDLFMTLDKKKISCRFLLPGAASSYQLEYFIEARDEAGRLLKRAGNSDFPLMLRVAGEVEEQRTQSGSIWTKWWLWTGLAVIAGGATTAVIFTTRETAPVGNLGPGRVELK